MCLTEIEKGSRPSSPLERSSFINDFAIVVATVNGSGSQTANTVIMRAIFQMGIPVTGKNLFPSNISGLPTWYTIRVSKDGYTARKEVAEILIAFNEKTAEADLAALPSGGVCIHPQDLVFAQQRDDVIFCPLPVKELVKQSNADPKLRDYIANMVYVGALAELSGIDLAEIKAALTRHFKGKRKAIDLNYTVVSTTAEWVRANLPKTAVYRIERLAQTDGLMLIDGNTAAALGALVGGMTIAAWYPITPSTSLIDALNEYAPRLRREPKTDAPTYAIVQAEDELAAIGIVIGAGWAGARAMTATSGPGLSLMTEFAGMGYFTEVPAVIWDVMRMGPSTGLPTRVSQGDILKAYYLGHGDTRQICLLPGSMQECFEFGYRAFDLAERLQTPVFVLSDLDLGMNSWMTEPFVYPTEPLDRGKLLSAVEIERLKDWGRYKDFDGDGIPYRSIPGGEHPFGAYLARGTGHNEHAIYSERPADWQANLDRLDRKHETARTLVPPPVLNERADATIGIIGYGSTDAAIQEARDQLRKHGVESSYLRIRALPLESLTRTFVERHKQVYVVELNQQGQMQQLVRLHVPECAAKVRSAHICNGLPMSASFVTQSILEQEKREP